MLSPTKVLAVTVRADIGGGPEHLYQLTAGFGSAVQTVIACPEDKPYTDRYRALDGVTQVVLIPHRAFKLGALWQLVRLVRREKIDLIHSHGKGAGLYARLVAALTGQPCVHTFHGLHVGEYGSAKKRVYLGLEQILGRATKAAIAVSEGEATQIRDVCLLPAAKLHVVENGVLVPHKISHVPQQDVLQVVAVNRYDHQKNPELLLEIAARLKAQGAPVFLTVIGQGEGLEPCRARAHAEGLDSHLTLAGPTNTPRVALQQAQVFLSTSRWEGMPLAVLEAMSEGLAPVLSDVVGNCDVVEPNISGLLYPSEDADQAVAHLVKLAKDPSLRNSLGKAAHVRTADLYSTGRMADQTLSLYLGVLDRAK